LYYPAEYSNNGWLFGSMGSHSLQSTYSSSSSQLECTHYQAKSIPPIQTWSIPHHDGTEKHELGRVDWWVALVDMSLRMPN
jgi:hypothetical protein